MNQTQIKYFLELAKSLNFSKTAESLYISQPTLSYQIAQLEQELGFDLFIRDKKSISLTEAGKYLQNELEEVNNKLNYTITHAKHINESKKKVITIGNYNNTTNLNAFYHAIECVKNEFTDFNIAIRHLRFSEILQAILQNKVDISFIIPYNQCENDQRYIIKKITQTTVYALIHKSHPLSKEKSITLQDIINENVFLPSKNISTFCSSHERYILNNPTDYNIRYCSDRNERIFQVAMNQGIMLTTSKESIEEQLFTAVPFSDAESIDIYLVYLADKQKLLQPIVDSLIENYKSQ